MATLYFEIVIFYLVRLLIKGGSYLALLVTATALIRGRLLLAFLRYVFEYTLFVQDVGNVSKVQSLYYKQ